MPDTAITVEDVRMSYARHRNQILGPIGEILRESFGLRPDPNRRVVLDGINFALVRGERMGIVGGNGAGKTTLLKIVAGLLRPDSGQVRVNGRLTAILALGLGVHPDFTGRESILFGGLLLGASRRNIESHLEDIVSFSGLAEFIDQPIRTYSSGMRARLYVSTALSMQPDVLVVDEALSTGDAAFADKCKRRVHEIARSGATTIFVSHNTQQMIEVCTRGLFLRHGRIDADGPIDPVVSRYLMSVVEGRAEEIRARDEGHLPMLRGSGDVVVSAVEIFSQDGQAGLIHSGQRGTIRLTLLGRVGAVRRVVVFVGLLRRDTGDYVGEVNSKYTLQPSSSAPVATAFDVGERLTLRINLTPALMTTNEYSLWIQITEQGTGLVLSEYKNVAPFYAANKNWPVNEGCAFWNPAEFVVEPAIVSPDVR